MDTCVKTTLSFKGGVVSIDVLFLVPDATDFFGHTLLGMAQSLKEEGWRVGFLRTGNYLERVYNLDFQSVGKVYSFDPRQQAALGAVSDWPIRWDWYPTYDRQTTYLRRHNYSEGTYRALQLFTREIAKEETNLKLVVSALPDCASIRIPARELALHGHMTLFYRAGFSAGHFIVNEDLDVTRTLPDRSRQESVQDKPAIVLGSELDNPTCDSQSPGALRLQEEDAWRPPAHIVHLIGMRGRVQRPRILAILRLSTRSIRSLEMGTARRYLLVALFRLNRSRALRSRVQKIKRFYRRNDGHDGLVLVYPAQFRPEGTNNTRARDYRDEFETLRRICFALPPGTRLIYRDHPDGISFLSNREYRFLSNLPGFERGLFAESSDALLARVDGVITLSSNFIAEALRRGKPAFVLGSVDFQPHPLLHVCQSTDALANALLKAFEAGKPHPSVMRVSERGLGSRSDNGDDFLPNQWPGSFALSVPETLEDENLRMLTRPMKQVLVGSD